MAALGIVPQLSVPDPGRFKMFGEFTSNGFRAALATQYIIPIIENSRRLAQCAHADHVMNFPDILL